ncbi:AsmA family protein [Gilvimarinus polysaccharolyticus]|uniref:AsmA family protein n=1 Tax=Gilvimarinus polysaccharolyticus TaxID=863921 RepID=UPI0018DE224F|nr:AsmA family protein [Gilvimarinus polysaccharolyticus]
MKTIVKVLVVLLLLVVLAAAALFFWLDPNIFKPRIKALAANQGIALEIAGDLSWQFWPSIGIEVADISVAALSTPDDQLAHLRSASLLVATRPLFDRQLEVKHLIIAGASVTFEVDQAGVSNWSRLADQAKRKAQQAGVSPAQISADTVVAGNNAKKDAVPPVGAATSSADVQLQLAVDTISVTDTQINYRDAALKRTADFTIKALKLTGFNAEGRPFALSADWLAQVKDPAMFAQRELQVAGELSAQVELAADLSQAVISEGDLTLEISGLDDSASVSAGFDLNLKNLTREIMFNGHLALAPVNIKRLLASLGQVVPVTAEADALTHLSISTNVSGSARSMALAPLTLTLDKTTVSGELSVTDFERMVLEVTLTGDRINVDHYLPPPVDEVSPVGTEASGDEPLIPLDAVRALNARLRIDLREAIVSGLALQNLRLRLNAADGLVQLTEASLDAYEGHLQTSGTLDGRGASAKINTKADIKSLNIAPLLSDLDVDKKVQVSGRVNLDATASTIGVSMNELLQAAVADANVNGAEVSVAPINVEKYFCQAMTLVKAQQTKSDAEPEVASANPEPQPEPRAEQDWPDYTAMHDLRGSVQLREQKITIKTFTAGVEQLLLALNGQIDLADQTFDLRLPLTLEQASSSAQGCTVNSNYWVNRSLSLLRCSGSIANLAPAKDCRLDSKTLESLLGDYTKYRLQKELVRKLGGDGENAKGEEETDPAKAVVKGLLNQLLTKDKNKTQSQPKKDPE